MEKREEKIEMEPIPELLEKQWVERTDFPVGMDGYNAFYPLDSITPITKEGEPLYSGIRNLTNDNSEINKPKIIKEESPKGFWSNLFGK